jgi:hypothetical protein
MGSASVLLRIRGVLLSALLLLVAGVGFADNVRVKGDHVYYIHRTAGLFILNKSLQVEKVISLPGDLPNDVDADTQTGNVFVACDGGVAFIPQSANAAQWIEDTITTGSLGGNPIQMKQGFTRVAVCDAGGQAFFCHSNDASGLTTMQGFVVRMPAAGGALVNNSPSGTSTARAFEALICDQTAKRVFSISYSGIFHMFDGSTGARLDGSALGDTPFLGGVLDCYFDESLGTKLVGGSFTRVDSKSSVGMIGYNDTGLLNEYGWTSPLHNSRPLRKYHGHYFCGLYESDDFDGKAGVAVTDSAPALFFDSGKNHADNPNRVHVLAPTGNVIFAGCDHGVMVLSAISGQAPQKIALGDTDGQGNLAELESGHVVGGALGQTSSLNGSDPIYLVEAFTNGNVSQPDLSAYALKLTSATPPIISLDGTRRVELFGENLTPDCKVYVDEASVSGGNPKWMATDVSLTGTTSLMATLPPVGFGPMDVLISNNNGRQRADKKDAVVFTRPDIEIQKKDFLIVDKDADPYQWGNVSDPYDRRGAIYRLNGDTGQMDLVAMGAEMYAPKDIAQDPVTGGWFLSIQDFPILSLNGGDSGVFGLDPRKGYFSVKRNLFAANEEFNIAQQILFTPDGRFLYLDSGANVYDSEDNIIGSGRIFEIGAAGSITRFNDYPFWNQPTTMDWGPNGKIYLCDSGDFFGGNPRNWAPGLHRVDPNTGYTELVFRNSKIGHPLDAAFTPEWKLLVIGAHVRTVTGGAKALSSSSYTQDKKGRRTPRITPSWIMSAFFDVSIAEVNVKAAPDDPDAVKVFYSPEETGIVPTCMAFWGRQLYFIGVTTDGDTDHWGLYRFHSYDHTHPELVQQLTGLSYPNRLVIVGPHPRADATEWQGYR